jgi:nitrogen fixation protein NifU and related proteins
MPLSPLLLDHFQNPRNVGSLDSVSAVTIEVTNPACGDILRLSALIQDGRISEVRYRTRGCTAAIASGSALTELILGQRSEELSQINAAAVEDAVGGLEPASKHAASLCVDAVRALVQKLDATPVGQ